MRGLTAWERDVLVNGTQTCGHGTWPSDSFSPEHEEAAHRLVKDGRSAYVICLADGGAHQHARTTALGKLALELDTIARSGKVEV